MKFENAKVSAVSGSKEEAKGKPNEVEIAVKKTSKATQARIDVQKAVDNIQEAMEAAGMEKWGEQFQEELIVGSDCEYHDEELDASAARLYRGVSARLNYIAPDRPDMGYAIKEAARSMSKPNFQI